ncbi:MAG: hypothetical protein K2Y01_07150 [Rhabdochlamydiaceae bacterium]|nr:hypothetical protein [Rhabdochlamydiaceae bacterium]
MFKSYFFLIVLLVRCSCVSALELLNKQPDNYLNILTKVESDDGNFIVAMTDEGSQQIQITTGPNDWHPAWLGSKNKILFLSDRNVSKQVLPKEGDPFYQPKAHLYIQEPGGPSRQLTFGDHKVWLPNSSPDGEFIAFFSDQDESFGDLYIIEVDTGHIERITTNKRWPMESAIWLSSSQLLFNMFIQDTLEIYVFDLKSKQLNQLTHSASRTKNGYISISPDHNHIAFVSRDRNSDDSAGIINPQIFIMDIDGKNRRQLTLDSFINFMPIWSPNGQQIIFLRGNGIDGKGNAQLRIIDKEGAGEGQINDDHILSGPKWIVGTSVIIYISEIDGHNRIRGFDLAMQRSYTISQDANDYSELAVRPILTTK